MATTAHATNTDTLRRAAHPLDELVPDYDPLLHLIGDARFVLLGEATHETHEFYRELLGSYEAMFHATRLPRFLLPLRDDETLTPRLREARLERAIGVIYRPETERGSHYFHARLADQFDAVLHFDETRAVEPLERTAVWDEGEVPETYPFAV